MESAVSIDDNPFEMRMAVMPGNEGDGLSNTQKAVCDKFVIIPHYGAATASLNVHVATVVVINRFLLWRCVQV